MEKNLRVHRLLLIVCLFVACDKRNERYNNLTRNQYERIIFQQNEISKDDLSTLDSLDDIGANFAFYREIPNIRGYTIGGDGNLFLVKFIIAYDFRQSKVGLEIGRKSVIITDAIRHKLSQLTKDDFNSNNTEYLRALLLGEVNRSLKKGDAKDILFERIEVYPISPYN